VAAGSPTLNQGPPLPPNLQPSPQASVAGLAGAPPQGGAPSGSAALQQAVVQKLMLVEQMLNDVGSMMPAAAPVISGFIDQMRKGMGALLAQGATPPVAPASGMAAGAGPMGPGGAPGS
jgi:hypothetical protein